MDYNLLKALIEKNVICVGTEVTIIRPGIYLNGLADIKVEETLEIQHITQKNQTYILVGVSVVNGKPYSFKAQHINKIDGMPPKRIATIYGLRPDGSIKPAGKKRGRKPKHKIE